MTPNTSQFTDQQSRNVSLCSSRGGKGKHIKLYDITFRRTGWWIAFFPLHLSLFSSSAFSPKRFLIFLSDRLWRNAFLTERDKHWCLLCSPPAASVYFCFSWVAPSCFLLCIVHMTNAIRPILMVYDFTPPSPGCVCIWVYKHSPLCPSTAVFLSSLYLCLLSWVPAYFFAEREQTQPLWKPLFDPPREMITCCLSEPSRPPELVQSL